MYQDIQKQLYKMHQEWIQDMKIKGIVDESGLACNIAHFNGEIQKMQNKCGKMVDTLEINGVIVDQYSANIIGKYIDDLANMKLNKSLKTNHPTPKIPDYERFDEPSEIVLEIKNVKNKLSTIFNRNRQHIR